ncbi:MAG: hypothetical protein EOP49_15450 [Sphingobacteriales bacterium]|nr:MAG: hypothetical protein EOP49_15450 [Sphingobacteriales bacterium]
MTPSSLITVLFASGILLTSCGSGGGEDTGRSTPIDSTNLNGTAPATYGGENPANYADTNLVNSNDTGTRIGRNPADSSSVGGNQNR